MFEMFKDSGKGKTKSTDKGKKKKSPDIRDMADPAAYRPRDASQRRIEESLKSHSLRARMGRAISRWFHSALIPAHKAKDPHFKAMVREIQRCGPNVTPPTPYEISGTYLDEVVVEVKEYIERFKEKWPEYGVTIMCDGWSGPTRLSIINFLVFCDGRTIFHKSVNTSAEIKDAAYLYRLMDEVVEEIGEENVVQIVTDNAANFKKAGLSLMQKRQHIYWTPCAAHCIDLIFKDIGEIKKIQDLVSDARRITNFIYNHTWVLALMSSHTLGDLVRPASTRFATNYVALSSLLERMDGLVQMFTSQDWFCSTYASSEPGRYVQDLVTSTRFWAKIRRVTGLMQPLFSILREVDGDKDQTMGILMDRMLKAMMTIVQLNTSESQKVAKIIDSRLGGMLLQDIHRAASYLNPTLQYQDARLGYDVEMLDALRRVVNRMEPDTIRAAAAVDGVEIFDPKIRCDAFKLQCRLKDIYFPYIQCDEMSTTGKTMRPIEFQVNGVDLTEIEGGEVAITNLHSCNGPEFVIQLRFSNTSSTSPGSKALREANARCRCVYFPIVEGKENIDRILEKLDEGYGIAENFETFCRVSIRRLGRLLPDARWRRLPFMETKQKKGDKAQLLKRCCMRVKCFVETDAGFNPTLSKTDLAHHHQYTIALKNLGCRFPEKENDTQVEIYRGGKPLSLLQLEKEYQDWVFQMHDGYDEEVDCGEDEPVLVVNPSNKKGIGISSELIRVHRVIRRKGASWKSGQKVKILKGAAAGCHKNNIYATLEYILLEGLQGDAGGEARLICRPLDLPDDKGCLLSVRDGFSSLDIRSSLSLPISVIDFGKFEAIDTAEWNFRLEKQRQKAPSTIDMLNAQHCQQLAVDGALPVGAPVFAGHVPPREIVAVVRPANFSSSSVSKTLDQKYIAKGDQEMYMEIKFAGEGKDCEDGEHIYGERVKPSSRKGFHGLYIFSLEGKIQWLFQRAGIYTFSFSAVPDSTVKRCEKKVVVKSSSKVGKWKLLNDEQLLSQDLSVGSCLPPLSVACYDVYGNRMPFTCAPKVLVKLDMKGGSFIPVDKVKVELSSNKMTIKVKDIMIESGEVDKIRPDYKTTLVICSQDELFVSRVPCQVAPGPLCHVRTQSSNLDKFLLPGDVIEKMKLEMLDAFGNHVKKGLEILVNVDGFCFRDAGGPWRKVDDEGCVDLSGVLKVTGAYGKNVSLSVHLDEKLLFKKDFQVEKRELRTVSKVPEYCPADYELKNIVFEVVNAEGFVDEAIHDEVKCGQSHSLTIKSGSLGIDDSVRYVFRHGRCTIPMIKVPSGQNIFHFEVVHSHYPELHMNFKIHILQDPKGEPSELVESDYSVDRIPLLPDSSLYVPKDTDSLVLSTLNDEKDLMEDLFRIGMLIGNHEEKLKMLSDRKAAIEQDVYDLQARMKPELSSQLDYIVNGKELILKQIERKGDTAAAVICNLSKTIQSQESQPYLKQDIVGIVSLIGTVNDITVSRIFAGYLGEDHMLAVVCKSYDVARALEKYEHDGKVDRRHALHAAATELGISINSQFLVICLENIRPYTGEFTGKNPQRKLALPDPLLPTGKIPHGFLGYAVNMINPNTHYLHIRTAAGHGLRETLFYLLFGKLQVYETRADMERAHYCIKHGAVSLDGGIMKGNGVISLGYREPEVCFPVIMPKVPVDFATDTIEILTQFEDKKLELHSIDDELSRESGVHAKAVKKFIKKKDRYNKLLDYKEPLVRRSQSETDYKSNIKEEY